MRCAFTAVDGAEFDHNSVIHPEKWFFRILTETKVEGLPPARNVSLSENTFTYRRSQVSTALNIGPDSAPDTFHFTGNHWCAADKPADSNPHLPMEDKDATYGHP